MNTVIAILVYLGIATCPAEVNSEMVEQNAKTILSTVDNPNFINYYESQYGVTYDAAEETENVTVVIQLEAEGD